MRNLIPIKKYRSWRLHLQNTGNAAKNIEFEHIVPAQNFVHTFIEWREGHPAWVTRKGKSFNCHNFASKTNTKYRHKQADMYNLCAAFGSVNTLSSNYNVQMYLVNNLTLTAVKWLSIKGRLNPRTSSWSNCPNIFAQGSKVYRK